MARRSTVEQSLKNTMVPNPLQGMNFCAQSKILKEEYKRNDNPSLKHVDGIAIRTGLPFLEVCDYFHRKSSKRKGALNLPYNEAHNMSSSDTSVPGLTMASMDTTVTTMTAPLTDWRTVFPDESFWQEPEYSPGVLDHPSPDFLGQDSFLTDTTGDPHPMKRKASATLSYIDREVTIAEPHLITSRKRRARKGKGGMYPCLEDGCDATFPKLKNWQDHVD